MEHSPIKYPCDDDVEDVEDGEISDGSDDGYTPLARPDDGGPANLACSVNTAAVPHGNNDAASAVSKMDEEASDKDDSLGDESSDSDSDNAIIGEQRDRKKRSKMRLMPHIVNTSSNSCSSINAVTTAAAGTAAASVAPRRKNNIWAVGLQEESLLENLKGCGVDRDASSAYDRSVESYDYSLRFRLKSENSLKRRKSSNSDSSNDRPQSQNYRMPNKNKRFHHAADGGSASQSHNNPQQKKKNVRQRLGVRRSDDSSSNDAAGRLDGPRVILDLEQLTELSTNESVAKDLATKLYEEKDELMLRIIEILGNELPLQVFVETQRIEANGGMMIMNGQRRRTPGGVFLFLLKNSVELSQENRKAIFTEESRKQNREQKLAQAQKRDRKVEQLKQTLRIENELTALATRSATEPQLTAIAASRVKDETLNNLSNPPPSPVTDGNRENSSDFDTHTIKHMVNMASPEKPSTSEVLSVAAAAAVAAATAAAVAAATAAASKADISSANNGTSGAYEDDFLDMNCDDMDLF